MRAAAMAGASPRTRTTSPLQAVTFVENHDTDTRPELQPVIANKMLAYAYILTAEGYPCVFYRTTAPTAVSRVSTPGDAASEG